MVPIYRSFQVFVFTWLSWRGIEATSIAVDSHGSYSLMRHAEKRSLPEEDGGSTTETSTDMPKLTMARHKAHKARRPPPDCLWGHWQEWTKCTVTCGRGMRTRQKSERARDEVAQCQNPKTKSENEACHTNKCPVTTSTTFTLDPFAADTTTEPDTESAGGGLASAVSDVASSLNPFAD